MSHRVPFQSNRLLFPIHQVSAYSMSPVHISPHGPIWIILIKQMVHSVFVNHSIRVVHPTEGRREVIYRAERFNIVRIECVTKCYFFPSHTFFVNIADTQCHVFILRKFERYTIVYFISCQTNIHIDFACFFIKQTYFCFIGLFFNR